MATTQYDVTFSQGRYAMTVGVHAKCIDHAQELAIDLMEELGEVHGEIIAIERKSSFANGLPLPY